MKMAGQPVASKLDPSQFVEKLEKVEGLEAKVKTASDQLDRYLKISGPLTEKLSKLLPFARSKHPSIDQQVKVAGEKYAIVVDNYKTAARDFSDYVKQNGVTLKIFVDYHELQSKGGFYTALITAEEFEQLGKEAASTTLWWIKTAGLIASGKKMRQAIEYSTLASTVKKSEHYQAGNYLQIGVIRQDADMLLLALDKQLSDENGLRPKSLRNLVSHLELLARATNSQISTYATNNANS